MSPRTTGRPDPALIEIIAIDPELDLRNTVRGAKDPVAVGPGELWWTTRTPEGVGTLALRRIAPERIEATAWGDGAGWMVAQAPRLMGADDDLTGFDPSGPVRSMWRRRPFRLARTDRLWDALVGAVLGQKVQVTKAVASRRALSRRFGQPAPGPNAGWVLPGPDTVAELGYFHLHPLGVERKRADTLIRVARELPRIEGALAGEGDPDPIEVATRLQRIRGIGPWSAALATAVALGDPDAVPVGDFHIPNTVAWALAGEPRATDERMLELLEPYRGHRWRVIRLAKAGGKAPKYGPRLSLLDDGMSRSARPD